jgi:hypothetical protein
MYLFFYIVKREKYTEVVLNSKFFDKVTEKEEKKFKSNFQISFFLAEVIFLHSRNLPFKLTSPEAGSLNKSSCLAPTLGVTKFIKW